MPLSRLAFVRVGLICVFAAAVRGSAAPRKLEKTRSSYSVHRVGGSRGAPKIKVQVLLAVCGTPSLNSGPMRKLGPFRPIFWFLINPFLTGS